MASDDLFSAWRAGDPSPLDHELALAHAAREPVIDLINCTPQENGFLFPQEILRDATMIALGQDPVRFYKPDAKGQEPAREAIAAYYTRRKLPTAASQLILTPGTSLGYYYALRLLLKPGDELLAPKPGYPLFDDLAAVAGVGLRRYHLRETKGHWEFDLDDLEFQITPRTRAIAVVSPHNPTGAVMTAEQYERLGAICRARGIAVLVDEVFAETRENFPRPRDEDFSIVITLNGVSKMFALPQWKIAWLRVGGDADLCAPLLHTLEHFSDTFLPVNELAQAITPELFAAADPDILSEFAARYAERRTLARELIKLPVAANDAGVYLCAKLPAGVSDSDAALRLLREARVLAHPGYYYDMPGHLVVTCVAEPAALREGIGRMNVLFRDRT
ncbi:pyridoxal phosphate-dependent aminotransferase [soil metagenome]